MMEHVEPRGGGEPSKARFVVAAVLLEDQGRVLRVVWGRDSAKSFTFTLPARAVHVAFDSRTSIAVCLTEDAELLVVSLQWRGIHSRFTGEGQVRP
jgi:hypothetical protein